MSKKPETSNDGKAVKPEETAPRLEEPTSADDHKAPAGEAEMPAEKGETAEPETGEMSVEELTAELERVRGQADEYLEGWQRERAEFANYRRRVDQEKQDVYRRAAAEVHARYLGILDDLELALKERPTEGEAAAWSEGIELIYRKLKALLEAEGIEPIPAEGEIFDPNLHEAVAYEESAEHSEPRVLEVVRQGYRLGDRVLRPALVRVAKPVEGEKADP